jgi:hypothetical protein
MAGRRKGTPKTGGRKRGTPNRRSAEAIKKAAAAGMLPHEFLCAVARGEEIDGHKPTFQERMTAARDAAPFYAARLTKNEHTGPDGEPLFPLKIEIEFVGGQ